MENTGFSEMLITIRLHGVTSRKTVMCNQRARHYPERWRLTQARPVTAVVELDTWLLFIKWVTLWGQGSVVVNVFLRKCIGNGYTKCAGQRTKFFFLICDQCRAVSADGKQLLGQVCSPLSIRSIGPIFNSLSTSLIRSRDSSVVNRPGYGLDDRVVVVRFPAVTTFRPVLGPNQPSIQWVSGLFPCK